MGDILFLPVKPKWAKLIMSGQKTLELRKRLPQKGIGAPCLIYASSPWYEVVGMCSSAVGKSFTLDRVDANLERACVTLVEFEQYFNETFWSGFEDAFDMRWYGIELGAPKTFLNSVQLKRLRAEFGIEPPQQWRYIDRKTFDEIVEAGR